MLTIKELLIDHCGPAAVFDRHLAWHQAKASSYCDLIEAALQSAATPVLIELDPDIDRLSQCILVDHHNERAGADQPTSLEQIFALLNLPQSAWTRHLQLVAANDRGWIPELRALGASNEEINSIRQMDRAAQGVEKHHETAARDALNQAQWYADLTLLLVRLPHAKTSPVTDALALKYQAPPNTLIISPDEVNFSGRGHLVEALSQAFEGGWKGGALPAAGFWGRSGTPPQIDTILHVLRQAQSSA